MPMLVAQSPKEKGIRTNLAIAARRSLAGQDFLSLGEDGGIDDRGMLAAVSLTATVDLVEIHPVLQEMGEGPLREGDTADDPAG